VLGEIKAAEGTTVAVGALLAAISNGAAAAKAAQGAPAPTPQVPAAKPAPAEKSNGEMQPGPAARKKLAEAGIDAATVAGSGKRGQILKEDVPGAAKPAAAALAPAVQPHDEDDEPGTAASAPQPPVFSGAVTVPAPAQNLRLPAAAVDAAREERVRMTKLRQTIAQRLKDAQNTAAILTTFNDVDMSAVMKLRREFKDLFEKRHGVKLGFMGLFVKACIQALREIPAVNAEIDGQDIVYKNYYHIGVAVGTDKGLVVPVLREADRMSLGEIEQAIADFGRRAREGKLTIEEMQGGTFTISNGGVYGSLMSTPILNAPQSGILGMHKIQERPVVVAGKIEVRPMMYLALSYDHRIVDGREAVTFLVRVKECLEDPTRLVLEL
jgi:2-oxoglutarate dehydrogenase E2 component (dihydrolipoamide succinyltransferase)